MSLTYRCGTPRDRDALAALLAGLSPESAYARFLTAVGSGLPRAVVEALLPDGLRGAAVLGFDGDALVAHGVWVRLGPSRTAEVALVVADSHQRRGIGTALADRLVAAAAARGIERIEAFSEGGNRAVARMVARGAPGAERERAGATVSYSFEVRRDAAAQPVTTTGTGQAS